MYVLDGTVLNLYRSSASPILQMRIIVNQDDSYSYQNDFWGRSLTQDQPNFTPDTGSLAYWVARFLAAPGCDPDPSNFGATRQAAVDMLYNYLWSYWSWGQANFTTYTGENSSAPKNPFFRAASDAQRNLDEFTGNLIGQ
jgi:hypothetical protein